MRSADLNSWRWVGTWPVAAASTKPWTTRGGRASVGRAAAVSAVYAFFVAVFIYKDIRLREVPKVLLSSAAMSAMLLYIITNAVLFSFVLANENIPQTLANARLS